MTGCGSSLAWSRRRWEWWCSASYCSAHPTMTDLIQKEVVSAIDDRTSTVCLRVAGQVRALDEPFDTPNGNLAYPPLHLWCRGLVVPYLPGTANRQLVEARREIRNREGRSARSDAVPPKPRVVVRRTRLVVPRKRRRPLRP